MAKYPEYEKWAKATLKRKPSWTDWHDLTLSEASRRALAMCQVASKGESWTGVANKVDLSRHLEEFAKAINEKYPPRRYYYG
jgi:hypothetical protein